MSVATRYLLFLLPFILAPGAPADLSARPEIERVSFSRSANGSTLVLRLHSSSRVPAYSEPRRIGSSQFEIILFNTDVAAGMRRETPESPVRQFDLARDGGHLKLRLDLEGDGAVSASAYRDRDTPDILIAIEYRGAPPIAAAPPVSTPASPPTVTQPPSTGVESPGNPGNTYGERWRMDTIVIDAGHGGRDAGAVANGIREKDVTLAVSLEVGRLIRENLGVNVVYTRTDDRFIELRERGRIANEAGGKLFVSIHANAANNRNAHGTETFILGPARTEAARRVMEKENQVIMLESNPEHYQRMTEEALIRQTLAQAAFIRKSEQLAEEIERQFANELEQNVARCQTGRLLRPVERVDAGGAGRAGISHECAGGKISCESGGAAVSLARAIFEAVSRLQGRVRARPEPRSPRLILLMTLSEELARAVRTVPRLP
jgi:N-acetylmuramoyl-L-alanine amidase